MKLCGTSLRAGALAFAASAPLLPAAHADEVTPATPVEHLVIIFQENVSFDHYFATYPVALNLPGEHPFTAASGTPAVDGLGTVVDGRLRGRLLTANANARHRANGADAINPFRLAPGEASTCNEDNSYGHEQLTFDRGRMDFFPGGEGLTCASPTYTWGKGKGVVMGYFDGNTVTALWTYAQHFAMSDNFYGSTFGPSTIGALNLAAGNTYPATVTGLSPELVAVRHGVGTLVGDLDPTDDVCSTRTEPTVRLGSRNIGDLLNARGVTWGAFMGGFDLRVVNADGSTGCQRQSPASPANGGAKSDYVPHHAWFQYFASTANPEHTPPSAAEAVGTAADGGARHQYDVHDFFDALTAGTMPAVSFMKAPAYADGHIGYSDPLLEQRFLVDTINRIMQSPFWKTTAIAITYDDSDGWYDHRKGPIVNPSAVAGGPDTDNGDHLDGPGRCGRGRPRADAVGRPIEGR